MEKENEIKTPKPNTKINLNLSHLKKDKFIVTSPQFKGIQGVGITPEQALDDLLKQTTVEFEKLAKNTLFSSLYKEDIQKKYSRIMQTLQNQSEKSFSIKKRTILFFEKILFKLKIVKRDYALTINIKESLDPAKIAAKIAEQKEHTEGSKTKLNFPDINLSQNFASSTGLMFPDKNLIIKNSPIRREIPIHFISEEGNELDDVFPFGVVVNLN